MTSKTNLLAGAAALSVAAAGAMLSTTAVAEPIPRAMSYADLLEPVPDAMSRLAVDDAAAQSRPAKLIQAQYWGGYGRPYYHHHHHHHHHHRWIHPYGWYWDGFGWAPRPYYHRYYHHHHHHHQHHHHYYWNDWDD